MFCIRSLIQLSLQTRMAQLFTVEIAEDAKDYLKDGGKIYLEIGYKQGQSVPELFRKHLPEKRVRTLKDQFGQDRMVVVDDGQD